MNHAKHLRHYQAADLPVSLVLRSPRREVGPLRVVAIEEDAAGFIAANHTPEERYYPYDSIEIIHPHVLTGVVETPLEAPV